MQVLTMSSKDKLEQVTYFHLWWAENFWCWTLSCLRCWTTEHATLRLLHISCHSKSTIVPGMLALFIRKSS
jgi:hypothetical protein